MIVVEVVYAADGEHVLRKALSLPEGSLVAAALQAAISEGFAGVDLDQATVGIFGRIVQRNHRLADGDRIEIYRPLPQDPKVARRKRAARQ